jgi:hypothetical protein
LPAELIACWDPLASAEITRSAEAVHGTGTTRGVERSDVPSGAHHGLLDLAFFLQALTTARSAALFGRFLTVAWRGIGAVSAVMRSRVCHGGVPLWRLTCPAWVSTGPTRGNDTFALAHLA